jgi:hypothetical protein
MFPYQCGGDAAGMGRRTSPCMTSVLNLGNSPRVPIVRVPETRKNKKMRRNKKMRSRSRSPLSVNRGIDA